MALATIIIPIYNVEPYLCRCVDSVLNQSVSDLEIILVDDGSPDRCPQLCDEYEKRDYRIKVIHKTNGGLASARNAGMRCAKGKYIFFLDSDDWIEPQTIGELVGVAEKYGVDFVRFRPMYAGWPNYVDGTLCDFGTEKGMREGLYQKEDIIRDVYWRLFATSELTLGVIVAAWRSLYCREFLKRNNLWFDEVIRYSEDTIFSAKVVKAANSFYYLDGPRYYHYFYNSNSITKSYKKDYWENNKKLMQCFEKEFDECEEYDFTKQLKLQKIYCILQAIQQRRGFKTIREKEQYCKSICDDKITIQSIKHIGYVKTTWKVYVILLLIKMKQSWLIARI